jgi:hypothetical protein
MTRTSFRARGKGLEDSNHFLRVSSHGATASLLSSRPSWLCRGSLRALFEPRPSLDGSRPPPYGPEVLRAVSLRRRPDARRPTP